MEKSVIIHVFLNNAYQNPVSLFKRKRDLINHWVCYVETADNEEYKTHMRQVLTEYQNMEDDKVTCDQLLRALKHKNFDAHKICFEKFMYYHGGDCQYYTAKLK